MGRSRVLRTIKILVQSHQIHENILSQRELNRNQLELILNQHVQNQLQLELILNQPVQNRLHQEVIRNQVIVDQLAEVLAAAVEDHLVEEDANDIF